MHPLKKPATAAKPKNGIQGQYKYGEVCVGLRLCVCAHVCEYVCVSCMCASLCVCVRKFMRLWRPLHHVPLVALVQPTNVHWQTVLQLLLVACARQLGTRARSGEEEPTVTLHSPLNSGLLHYTLNRPRIWSSCSQHQQTVCLVVPHLLSRTVSWGRHHCLLSSICLVCV